MLNRMQNRLAQLRQERAEGDDKGFTLIELLVVVVIIGILIAIAIPLYLHFENGAKNNSAESDTKNAVSVIQQCANDANGTLPGGFTSAEGTNQDLTCGTGAAAVTETVVVSDNNTMVYSGPAAGTGEYTVVTTNSDTGNAWTYDSSTGKTTKTS